MEPVVVNVVGGVARGRPPRHRRRVVWRTPERREIGIEACERLRSEARRIKYFLTVSPDLERVVARLLGHAEQVLDVRRCLIQ